MSAGRDAWSALLGMVEDAIASRTPEEQCNRLAQINVLMWKRVAELGKPRPDLAGKIAAASWAQMSGYRPESPCALDQDFKPTEAVPTSPPGGDAA